MVATPCIDSLFSIESSSSVLRPIDSSCGEPLTSLVASMNRLNISSVMLAPCTRWQCERHWICGEIQLDEVLHYVTEQPMRFAGLVSYNPNAIVESLKQVSEAIREHDFRGVYVHTEGSDVRVGDRRMYPLYARCVELEMPVVIQVGGSQHIGHSMARASELSSVLVDFPDLQVVAAWTGTIHVGEIKGLCAKHASLSFSLHGDVAAGEEAAFVDFLCGEGRSRCMWGSNGLPWDALLNRIVSYALPEPVSGAFLHDTAARVFGLTRPSRATRSEVRVLTAERD